jgi:hypothetical protein
MLKLPTGFPLCTLQCNRLRSCAEHLSAKTMGFRPFPEPRSRSFLATSGASRAWCSSAGRRRNCANFFRHSRRGAAGCERPLVVRLWFWFALTAGCHSACVSKLIAARTSVACFSCSSSIRIRPAASLARCSCVIAITSSSFCAWATLMVAAAACGPQPSLRETDSTSSLCARTWLRSLYRRCHREIQKGPSPSATLAVEDRGAARREAGADAMGGHGCGGNRGLGLEIVAGWPARLDLACEARGLLHPETWPLASSLAAIFLG